MKCIENEKIKVIFEKDPAAFEQKYNRLMDDLNGHSAEVSIDTSKQEGFCAIVRYTGKALYEAETDFFTINDIIITCQCCPYLKISTDNRKNDHPYKYGIYGTVKDFTPACEFFRKQEQEGNLDPVE